MDKNNDSMHLSMTISIKKFTPKHFRLLEIFTKKYPRRQSYGINCPRRKSVLIKTSH